MKVLSKMLALIAVTIIITDCKKLPEFHDGDGNNGGETPVVVEPVVRTASPENITEYSADFIGYVSNYDIVNTDFWVGFCLNTTGNPTVSDPTAMAELGENGRFQLTEASLSPNTTYYLRAFAMCNNKSFYGDEVSFSTLGNGGGEIPSGATNGLYTISYGNRVYFAKGNLQYQASTNIWRFADKQWDYVGENNANISAPTYNGWMDLFGWGTGDNPTNISTDVNDYNTFNDWGNNAIINGGNQVNMWRTLSQSEWAYVFNVRSTTSGIRYAKSIVNEINGVLLLPDDWDSNNYSLSNTNVSDASFSSNIISLNDWNTYFEFSGAVFLPAAGYREATSITTVGSRGHYWSANRNTTGNSPYYVYFINQYLYVDNWGLCCDGLSVRLVCDIE